MSLSMVSTTGRSISVPAALLLLLICWILIAAANQRGTACCCTAFQAASGAAAATNRGATIKSTTIRRKGSSSSSSSNRFLLFRVHWSNNNKDTSNKIVASPPSKVVKSDDEWEQELSVEAYYVLRQAGTERPGSSELNNVKKDVNAGTFVCRGCGAPLFTTATKFESGSGWPSFFQPINGNAVDLSVDFKLILPRTEVLCATCGGHLGHVFDDGPEPTGQRYCMNGVAMKFQSDTADPDLANAVLQRQRTGVAFKPSVASQVPGILLNGGIGVLFFSSFVSRISDLAAMGSSPGLFDFFPILPAVYYGVVAGRGISRLR